MAITRRQYRYLRKRFGGMLRATTDAEALADQRTLTLDGMIVQSGEYDRIKPIAKGHLKIGGGDNSQKEILSKEISGLNENIRKIKLQQKEIKETDRQSWEYHQRIHCNEIYAGRVR